MTTPPAVDLAALVTFPLSSAARRASSTSRSRLPPASSPSAHRPLGLRQDHPAAGGSPASCVPMRAWWRLGGEDVTDRTGPRARMRRRVPGLRPVSPHAGLGERGLSLAGARRAPRRTAAPGRRDAGAWSASPQEAERLPAQLSGGQQQRVALARALVFRPRALCPTSRFPRSTPPPGSPCARRSAASRRRRASPRFSSPTTRTRRSRWVIAWPCCARASSCNTRPPHEIYDRPADAFVAGFVGRANLLEGHGQPHRTCVDTPIGPADHTCTDGSSGTPVRVLLRPERILPAADAAAGGDLIPVRHPARRASSGPRGASGIRASGGPARGWRSRRRGAGAFAHVRVPPEAVQFLPQP